VQHELPTSDAPGRCAGRVAWSPRQAVFREVRDEEGTRVLGGGGRSKQWTGQVQQGADGLAWHNHYRLDRILATVRWEAEAVSRLLATRAAALLCVHGAHVQRGGVDAGGVAIVPAGRLRDALGPRPGALSDGDVDLLATTAWTSLRPAA
jgi:hypothetical protein